MGIEEDEIVGFEEPESKVDQIAYAVIGAAIEVHRELGPGHPEIAYENALEMEFELRGIRFSRQHRYSIEYKGREIATGRADFLVEGLLVLEIKACDELAPIHTSQLVSYLRAMNLQLGILLNFNVKRMKDGVRRVANTQK